MKNRIILFVIILLGCVSALKAQNREYSAEIDTNYIMIGDQIHFRMKVKAEPGVKVAFPQLKDTIAQGIEIISGPVRDSIMEKDGRVLVQESYVITSFDSGVFVIPPMPIEIQQESYNNTLRTDPLHLIVNTFVVDQQKGNYDIVMPLAAPWTFAEILPYLLWTLLGIVVILLVVWIIKVRKSRKSLFHHEKPAIPPYVLAMKALEEIKKEKLWQSGKTKEYYTQLTDTIRNYLDGELGISAMEQTSFETLKALEKCEQVNAKQRDKLADMFETADFVKFAKAEPLQDENVRNLDIAYDFVQETNDSIRAEQEKERLEQELKAAGVRYEYVEAGNVEDFQGYKNAVNAVLNSMPVDGVDAVVSSDIGAALCVREAMRRHISIPRDLQIIAYDGTYLTDLAGMKMTAVAQNFDKIAQVAVGNIVRAIAKEGDAKADTTSATGRKPYEPDVLIPVTRKLGDTTR